MRRIVVLSVLVLFGVIGLIAFFRKDSKPTEEKRVIVAVEPKQVTRPVASPPPPPVVPRPVPPLVPKEIAKVIPKESPAEPKVVQREEVPFTEFNRMEEFFNVGLPKFPVVETITYTTRAPWVNGRSAWITDYAAHFKTSRHFIARSLNKAPDYDKQMVSAGDRFNVFKEDYPLSFHLVVDTSNCTLSLYYFDELTDERTLVKTCRVGLGRHDKKKASGMLTPWGTYTLGDKIAVYKPGKIGQYNKEDTEMLQIFGTRWIPLADEVEDCTEPAKGFGIHGCPWMAGKDGEYVEDTAGLGRYESDGCIRLLTKDMEEIFAVIITKPSTLYLVSHKAKAHLPGREVT